MRIGLRRRVSDDRPTARHPELRPRRLPYFARWSRPARRIWDARLGTSPELLPSRGQPVEWGQIFGTSNWPSRGSVAERDCSVLWNCGGDGLLLRHGHVHRPAQIPMSGSLAISLSSLFMKHLGVRRHIITKNPPSVLFSVKRRGSGSRP